MKSIPLHRYNHGAGHKRKQQVKHACPDKHMESMPLHNRLFEQALCNHTNMNNINVTTMLCLFHVTTMLSCFRGHQTNICTINHMNACSPDSVSTMDACSPGQKSSSECNLVSHARHTKSSSTPANPLHTTKESQVCACKTNCIRVQHKAVLTKDAKAAAAILKDATTTLVSLFQLKAWVPEMDVSKHVFLKCKNVQPSM